MVTVWVKIALFYQKKNSNANSTDQVKFWCFFLTEASCSSCVQAWQTYILPLLLVFFFVFSVKVLFLFHKVFFFIITVVVGTFFIQ